jgi:hypothetical protein
MRRKGLIVLAIAMTAVVVFSMQGCKSNPESSLLSAYFHSISMKDTSTMATMALEPMSIEAQSWQIVAATPEQVKPFDLADLNKKELDFKKKLEDHVGPVMEAEDAKYAAEEEVKTARTAGARAAANQKVKEASAKYDQEREAHRQLQKGYNDGKAAAQREQDIALFSLGAREMPSIRDMTGTVHSKTVDVKVIEKGGKTETFRFALEQYTLRDETANFTRTGAWKIIKAEPIS